MVFDKQVFKEHYGKLHSGLLKADLIVCAGCAVILSILLLTGITVPSFFAVVIILPPALSIFPILPLLLCFYVASLKAAERQTQKLQSGRLVVELVPEAGHFWGIPCFHTLHYEVQELRRVTCNQRYIIVEGTIALADINNGNVKHKSVTSLKIPIVFQNYEKIMSLGGTIDG